MSVFEPTGEAITLTYRNWRGETAVRTITPKRIWFGLTDWHPDRQWLITAFDHDKQADRDFALKDFGVQPAGEVEPVATGDPLDSMDERVSAYLAATPPDASAIRKAHKFQLGDRVTKVKGSKWTGRVVGFYSTALTPVGYAVESETETGSVQIYPEAALASVDGGSHG